MNLCVKKYERFLKVISLWFNILFTDPVPKKVIQSSDMKNSSAKQKKQSGTMLKKTKLMLYNFFKPYNSKLAIMIKDVRYQFQQPFA